MKGWVYPEVLELGILYHTLALSFFLSYCSSIYSFYFPCGGGKNTAEYCESLEAKKRNGVRELGLPYSVLRSYEQAEKKG